MCNWISNWISISECESESVTNFYAARVLDTLYSHVDITCWCQILDIMISTKLRLGLQCQSQNDFLYKQD